MPEKLTKYVYGPLKREFIHEPTAFEKELLQTSKKRFVYGVPKNQDIVIAKKKHEDCFWTAHEIDLGDDSVQWNNGDISISQKAYVLTILAFFASSDGLVMENLGTNFSEEAQLPEVRSFYAFQMAMEDIHSQTYSMMISTLVPEKMQYKLFNSVLTHSSIANKIKWTEKYMNKDLPFSKRLIAFAVVEGIFFSSSFCGIFWFKKNGKLPGISFSNELISRDEGMHTDFACLLYSKMTKWPLEMILEIVTDAVKCEQDFVDSCFEDGDIYREVGGVVADGRKDVPTLSQDMTYHGMSGMNRVLMKQYVEFVADRLLLSLGYIKHYNTPNPFNWMELISLQGKTNFFEKRVSEYSRASTHGKKDENGTCLDNVFTLDADF